MVFWLDATGKRRGEVPTSVRNGALCFRVSARGPSGARLYYEIIAVSGARRVR